MSYESNKAEIEQRPVVEGPSEKPSLGPLQSNQEQATGDGVRTVPMDTSGSDGFTYNTVRRQLSNQVKFETNGKGSTTLKDPLNTYSSKVYPPVTNPYGPSTDKFAYPAAGRKTNGPPSL